MKDPTTTICRLFWHHFVSTYETTIVVKSDAEEMDVLAEALEKMGVVDRKKFMENFSTAIGKRIYVPFRVGYAEDKDIWTQMVLCAHEHLHVAQFLKEGAMHSIRYMSNSAARAHYEAEAYRVNMELGFWRWRGIDHEAPSRHAQKLRSYGVSDADIRVTEKMLRLSSKSILRGARPMSEVSRQAIAWLEANAPEIRA